MRDGTTEAEITRLQHEWMDAWRLQDRPTLERILADDFTLTSVTTDDLIHRDVWLASAMGQVRMTEFSYSDFHIQFYRDTAVVKSRFHQRGTIDGNDWSGDFLVTDMWVRRDGLWQVVSRHASCPSGRTTGGRMGPSR